MSDISFNDSIHRFIDDIVRHGEDPSCWPLTRDEQIAFCRSTIYQARQIAKSEAYLAQAVEIKSSRVEAWKRQREDRLTVGEVFDKFTKKSNE